MVPNLSFLTCQMEKWNISSLSQIEKLNEMTKVKNKAGLKKKKKTS